MYLFLFNVGNGSGAAMGTVRAKLRGIGAGCKGKATEKQE